MREILKTWCSISVAAFVTLNQLRYPVNSGSPFIHAPPHVRIQLYPVLKSSVIWPTPVVKSYLIFTLIVFSPTMVN